MREESAEKSAEGMTLSASDRGIPPSGAGQERLLVRSTRRVGPGCLSRGWCTGCSPPPQQLLKIKGSQSRTWCRSALRCTD